MARAKLATAGAGSPRGRLYFERLVRICSFRFNGSAYHAMKHKIEAVKRREPNPPKIYVNHLDEASNISALSV